MLKDTIPLKRKTSAPDLLKKIKENKSEVAKKTTLKELILGDITKLDGHSLLINTHSVTLKKFGIGNVPSYENFMWLHQQPELSDLIIIEPNDSILCNWQTNLFERL